MSGSSKEVTYSLAAPVSQKDPVSQKETQDVEMTAGIPGLSSIMSPRNSAKGPYTPFTPKKQEFAQDIIWSKVNFKVGEKDILQDCYGSVPAGKVAAILGPSGAGKSSLLNVLAGRSSSGKNISISAEVAVAGKKIDPVEFRKRIAYVMQEDALLPTATPREALRFSGMLRLDPADHKDLNEKVEFVLDELGLVDCADTYIGGALIKGISGGQKKRTSIGVEIITEPALLFLDEPTSGLDSYSAFTCVSLFKRIAETDAAVLCTIHQPSSEVFALFDIAIFMQSGRILYQGPTENIVPYFAKFGYKCPINYNPSDFVMFLAQTETVEQITETGLYGANDEVRSSIETRIQPLPKLEKLPKVVEPSTFLQTYLLTKRECVNTYRDVGALVGRFGISSVLSLIYGLIFLGAGDRNDANINNFQDHFGAVTFLTISCMFGSSQSVLLAFPYERPLFLRENSTGTCK
jgi:ABC-type multidrug transport system ATPase subunit